jgi:hypothetical protein
MTSDWGYGTGTAGRGDEMMGGSGMMGGGHRGGRVLVPQPPDERSAPARRATGQSSAVGSQ